MRLANGRNRRFCDIQIGRNERPLRGALTATRSSRQLRQIMPQTGPSAVAARIALSSAQPSRPLLLSSLAERGAFALQPAPM